VILREICYHFENKHEMPFFDGRDFNLKIGHIIDSIYLRMPRSIKTDNIRKLNVCVDLVESNKEYWAFDGIGMAFVACKQKNELPFLEKGELYAAVISLMKNGALITAKHDRGVSENIDAILRCLDQSAFPFDYHRKIQRSHRTKKYKAEAIVNIQADKYLSQVLVSDKLGNIERITVTEVEPMIDCVNLGFDKLIWEQDELRCYRGDNLSFKLNPKIIKN
jgi:hypothetical protein